MFKRKRLIFVFGIIIAIALIVSGFLRQKYVLPILMYHSVTPMAQKGNRLAVTDKTFRSQMRYLRKHEYNIISLADAVKLIGDKKKIPPKTVAVTFDDGYRDNYLYAFPIIKEYKIPVTLFIIVREVGRAQGDRLSWGEIRDMRSSGLVTIGSHAIGPDPLYKAKSEEDLKSQIFASKSILEEKLGGRIDLFSYPEGAFDAKIRRLVIDAGYIGAVATNPGRDYPADDVFALKRLRISENSANMFIFATEASGYYTFMKEWKKRGKR